MSNQEPGTRNQASDGIAVGNGSYPACSGDARPEIADVPEVAAATTGEVAQSSVLSPQSYTKRRGRPPADRSFFDLDETLQCDIYQAIDSAANESGASIFRRFGLAQRGLKWRNFSRMVSERRARKEPGTRIQEPGSPSAPSWEDLDAKCRRLVDERLDAGDAKIYEIVGVMQATFKRREVVIKEDVEARDAEIHAAKMETLKKTVAVESETKPDKKLTADEVADMIDRVMRGEEVGPRPDLHS